MAVYDSAVFVGNNLTIYAMVEDCVQVAAATAFDPPAFGSAMCRCSIPWDAEYGDPPMHSPDLLMQLARAYDDWEVLHPDEL